MSMVLTIILSALGSSGVFAFLTYLIQRHDNKKNDIQQFTKRLDKIEKDSCRTQMLILMSDYPEEKQELMKLAEHYFADLKGDWYMTSMFGRWLTGNEMEKPAWFREEK